MDYEKSIDFTGDPQKAITLAQTTLVQSGYKIIDISETSISARHEGGFVKSQSGNPMYAASPVVVSVSESHLVVIARYEGVEKAKKFLVRLLAGMAFGLGLGLGIPFGLFFEEKWPMILGFGLGFGIPLIQLPIHLLVTPMIMKKRAAQALDALVHNMKMIS